MDTRPIIKLKNIDFSGSTFRPKAPSKESNKLNFPTYNPRIPIVKPPILSPKHIGFDREVSLKTSKRNLMDFKSPSFLDHPFDAEKVTHKRHFKYFELREIK